MFTEEAYETHITGLIEDAQTVGNVLYDEEIGKILSVSTIGASDVTLENFPDYARISPAVIVGFTPDQSVLNTMGARNDSQMMAFSFRVFLLVQALDSRNSATNDARPILRALRNLLRGLRYKADDGYTRLIYAGQSLAGESNGVALIFQEYELHGLDTNTTERTL